MRVGGGFDEEHERDHGEREDAKNPENINKSEHRGLAQELVVKERLCLVRSGGGTGTVHTKRGSDAVKRLKITRIERGEMADKIGLMPLGETSLERGDKPRCHRRSEASAGVKAEGARDGRRVTSTR